MAFREFFTTLPLINQVDPYQFYIKGYTEALRCFSDVRVVLSDEWLSGVPSELKDYFYRVGFPCYFIPIFSNNDCFGFVVKGFKKETPRFCTNMFIPGCEKIKGGEVVVLVEGLKDAYIPIKACHGLPVVVLSMLSSVPSKDFLAYLKQLNCSVLFVPDNDIHRANHTARFFELCGRAQIRSDVFHLEGTKDFGDFFTDEFRSVLLSEGKRLRMHVLSHVTF